MDRFTVRQTDRFTVRQTGRFTVRQMDRFSQTDGQIYSQTDGQIYSQTDGQKFTYWPVDGSVFFQNFSLEKKARCCDKFVQTFHAIVSC